MDTIRAKLVGIKARWTVVRNQLEGLELHFENTEGPKLTWSDVIPAGVPLTDNVIAATRKRAELWFCSEIANNPPTVEARLERVEKFIREHWREGFSKIR